MGYGIKPYLPLLMTGSELGTVISLTEGKMTKKLFASTNVELNDAFSPNIPWQIPMALRRQLSVYHSRRPNVE